MLLRRVALTLLERLFIVNVIINGIGVVRSIRYQVRVVEGSACWRIGPHASAGPTCQALTQSPKQLHQALTKADAPGP